MPDTSGREIRGLLMARLSKANGRLHMDGMSDWPAGWEDVVGDHPENT